MSNADGDIIPIVEDDKTGETWQDLVEDFYMAFHNDGTELMERGFWEKPSLPKEISGPSDMEVLKQKHDKLERKLNRIMIHLGIDDKSEILIT